MTQDHDDTRRNVIRPHVDHEIYRLCYATTRAAGPRRANRELVAPPINPYLGKERVVTSAPVEPRVSWRGTRFPWFQEYRGRGSVSALGHIVIAILILFCAARPSQAQTQAYIGDCQPRILVLRGLCEVFSLGMNDLASKLSSCGYDVELTSWSLAYLHARDPQQRPLVVIGHSLGGRMCARVARKLEKDGVPVPLIIIVDANLQIPIPKNVYRCMHLYVTNELGIFHGSPVSGAAKATKIVNWDVSKAERPWWAGHVDHFNIDASPWIHKVILGDIARMFPPPRGMDSASEVFDPTVVRQCEQSSDGSFVHTVEWSFSGDP